MGHPSFNENVLVTLCGSGLPLAVARPGIMGPVLTLRADLRTALIRAEATSPVALDWLVKAPPGAHRLERVQVMPTSADLDMCARELLRWGLHRRAGLQVLADGDAAPGTNVVLQAKFGPLSALAPCRVTSLIAHPDRVGFEYATLPGHPEQGVERFEFVRDTAGEMRFEVRAVSRPGFIGSRALPLISRLIQRRLTDRYVRAALDAARRQ